MDEIYQQLKKYGKVRLNEPMSKHTTFKIGGPARYFVFIDNTSKLVELLQYLDGEGVDHFIIGGGSNTLVNEDGYEGVVIKMKDSEIKIEGDMVQASSGASTAEVAQKSFAAGLTGFEWGVGIPGTIGGAARGNAGCMGGEVKDYLEKVEVYRDGEVIELDCPGCEFSYRTSIFKNNNDIILKVWLKLEKGDGKEVMKKALQNLNYRRDTQPQGFASSGCIFKNPKSSELGSYSSELPEELKGKEIIPAGWLIEKAGMKGEKVGGAEVSERHGNFIVNIGDATGSDVLTLIEKVKEAVYNKFKVNLEEEVKIL